MKIKDIFIFYLSSEGEKKNPVMQKQC